MESKAKMFGHAIHPILIVFPLGLLATSVIFDVVYLLTSSPTWHIVSFWMITAGIIGGLLAAVFGLIDFLNIPSGTRASFPFPMNRTEGMLEATAGTAVACCLPILAIRRTKPVSP